MIYHNKSTIPEEISGHFNGQKPVPLEPDNVFRYISATTSIVVF
jgi:hypothetical protein